MKKSELIEELCSELNLPVVTATGIVNTILNSMTDELVKGGNVELRGFVSFSVRNYDPYTGREHWVLVCRSGNTGLNYGLSTVGSIQLGR